MKIKGAILHQPVAVPGLMAPNINVNTTKCPGIRLKWENERGLLWKYKDREGFFPMATVSCVEVETGSLWIEDKKKAA